MKKVKIIEVELECVLTQSPKWPLGQIHNQATNTQVT